MRHGCSSPSFCCSPRSLFVATCVCPRPCCRKQDNARVIGQTMHECSRACMHGHSFGVTRPRIRARISCAARCDRCVATCANDSSSRLRCSLALLDVNVRGAERERATRACKTRPRRSSNLCSVPSRGANRRRDRPARRSRHSSDRARASRRSPRCGRLREASAAVRSLT